MNKQDEFQNEFMKIFNQDFSQETTDEEAIEFLEACPMGKETTKTILNGYFVSRLFTDSPYRALKITLQALIDTLEQIKKEGE
jgi:hypothetical protein